MRISKSTFKNLIRCPRYYSFYKNDAENTPHDQEHLTEFIENSHIDFDEEDYDIEKLDAMNDYYTKVELAASNAAIFQFGGSNIDLNSQGGQKQYSNHINDIELFCYTDIVNFSKNNLNFIEVKSCTNRKFEELGPKINKVQYSIFKREGNIYRLKDELGNLGDIPKSKYLSNRSKLLKKYDDVGKYVYDLSIQRFIYENSDSFDKRKNHKYYLAILNKDYVFDGVYKNSEPIYNQINGQNVINFVDLTEITKEMMDVVQEDFNTIKSYIAKEDNVYSKLGKSCFRKKITECKYLKDCCTYLAEENTIGELSGISYTNISKFFDEGKIYIRDLEGGDITNDRQLKQVEVVLNEEEFIDEINIKNELSQLEYPIYHLDFETFSSPLPRFIGESPSSVYTFQFSIHVEKEPGVCDENDDHIEFLARDYNDYREEICRLLVELIDLTKGGTVIAWNKSFEMSRMRELAEAIPKYREGLLKIVDKVYDLMDMFKGKKGTNMFAYRKEMKGSFSIKYVLPAYTNISYNDMDVNNGLMAMAAYASYPKLTKPQLSKLTNDLILYCKQDTWAMVELLRVCRQLIL